MKTFTLFTIFVFLVLTNQMFSQVNNKLELRPDNLLQEIIIPHSIQDEQARGKSESPTFQSMKSRTLVSKTVLDSLFLLEEELWQEWDGSNWVDDYKDSHTYDVNNNRIELLLQDWDGSNFVNDYKYTFTYDGNNNMIEELYQTWDGSNWVNYIKETYTYDVNNNMMEVFVQNWGGSNWVNNTKITNTFDVNNNLIERLEQEWDGSNWVNNTKITNTFDVNNNLIEQLVQYWDGSTWVNSAKIELSYILIITGIEQLTKGIDAYSLSNNYPNPFNPSTTISYSVPELSFVIIKIYDVLGSEVAILANEEKPIGSYEVDFNASALSSGVYFYRLQAGSFVETKKMVLMK